MTTSKHSTSNGQPPVAKRVDTVVEWHGDRLLDPYSWLRDAAFVDERRLADPDVMSYLVAENAYTDAMTESIKALEETLFQELRGRMKEDDQSVPYTLDRFVYYSRTETGKQYPIHCRRSIRPGSPEEVILDVNELAEGHQYFSVGLMSVTDSGNLFAYTTDSTGFRRYTLHIKDLRTGELLPDTAEGVTSFAWAKDNRTFFYAQENEVTKRPGQVFRHKLGQKRHHLVYEDKNELFYVGIYRPRDHEFVFAISSSKETSEISFVSARSPRDAFQVVEPRRAGHRYEVDHQDGWFFIVTNDGAKNFRLAKTPVAQPGMANWQEVVAHRPEVQIEDIDLFDNHMVRYERSGGLQHINITDVTTGESHYIAFPDPVYSTGGSTNPSSSTTKLRFSYMSLTTPSSTYEYDMNSRELSLLKQQEVLGYYSSLYESERIFATADDGTLVPMSLVYKKGVERIGVAPGMLYGYGSYGVCIDPSFRSSWVSLLDRGFVCAIAHIRGGGELGEPWHEAGKMKEKETTFTDFIACVDHLVAEGYVARDRLVIEGGSAGGLLMGAVLNMRRDLCKVALIEVPFVDVVNTMLDETLPLTVGEFEEWGNPKDPEYYWTMKGYSPYDNMVADEYPSILVTTALYDSQVMYWEPAKYVARLRATMTGKNPLLFKILLEAGGHGGLSGRFDALKERAFACAFFLNEVGITE